MQLTILEEQTTPQELEIPATPSTAEDTVVENSGLKKSYMAPRLPPPSPSSSAAAAAGASGRSRLRCTCSNHPGAVPCIKHGYIVPPRQNMRRYSTTANKEILRRALTPPNKKLTLRWWNFRPTPSRLSNMSMGS